MRPQASPGIWHKRGVAENDTSAAAVQSGSAGTVANCRVFGIMARSAPVAALLRRGPSRWVQMLRWHAGTDTVEPGQWFRGRIYERRCDLSPDGRLFLYFASKI